MGRLDFRLLGHVCLVGPGVGARLPAEPVDWQHRLPGLRILALSSVLAVGARWWLVFYSILQAGIRHALAPPRRMADVLPDHHAALGRLDRGVRLFGPADALSGDHPFRPSARCRSADLRPALGTRGLERRLLRRR